MDGDEVVNLAQRYRGWAIREEDGIWYASYQHADKPVEVWAADLEGLETNIRLQIVLLRFRR